MIEKNWYSRKKSLLSNILRPVSYVFAGVATQRKKKQQQNQYKSQAKVVVVGNISIGGTGKTPVVRAICEYLLQQGKKIAIVSRGYGGKADNYPFEISVNTKASECGDEPFMMYDALRAKVPIIIDSDRSSAVRLIEKKYPDIEIVICDDGLQHYKLARDYEIVVVDAMRMFGNELLIPAGPLREPVERIKSVNAVIAIGDMSDSDKHRLINLNKNLQNVKIKPTFFVNVKTLEKKNLFELDGKSVTAVAGIGNPKKFIASLNEVGCEIESQKIFKDHHAFSYSDFADIDTGETVVMTYKDAVKCRGFASDNWWYLDIGLNLSESFLKQLSV